MQHTISGVRYRCSVAVKRNLYRAMSTLRGPTKTITVSSAGDETMELRIREQLTAPPGGATIDATGRIVWPTAVPLMERIQSDYLENHGSPCRVLELGSGCGVLGMGLAATGSANVVLTDQSVDWLESNVELNRDIVGDRAKVAPLRWGDEDDAAKLDAAQNQAPFDLIVGSDILYDHSTHDALVATMRRFALPKNAAVVLAYPPRRDEEPFLLAANEFFNVTIEPLSIVSSSQTYSLAVLSCKTEGTLTGRSP
jgi:hypothetical protein